MCDPFFVLPNPFLTSSSQRAAGVFESLKSDIDAHPQSAEDLRGEALSMLISLMLAQAQECFFLKVR